MGTYLVTRHDRNDVSNNTQLSRVVLALTSVFDEEARDERRKKRNADPTRYVNIGWGRDDAEDMDLLCADDYILARGFELADEALPWSVHLIPPMHAQWLALIVEHHPFHTAADFKETFDEARDIIHQMAVEKQTVLVT